MPGAVYAADFAHAGTDANVSIVIYGDNGDTGQRKLTKKICLKKVSVIRLRWRRLIWGNLKDYVSNMIIKDSGVAGCWIKLR